MNVFFFAFCWNWATVWRGQRDCLLEKQRKRRAVSSWHRHAGSVGLNSKHPFEHYTFKSLWIQRQKTHLGKNLEDKLKLRTLSVLYSYGRQAIKLSSTSFSSRLFYDIASIERWEIPLPINIPFLWLFWKAAPVRFFSSRLKKDNKRTYLV